jgi:hypothetical protein
MSNINGLGSTNVVIPDSSEKKVDVKSQEPQVNNEGTALKSCDKVSFKSYTVQKGDNLWNISKQEYNNPTKWPNIFEANKDQIKDPNLIYPKQVLRIPVCDTTPEQPQEPTPVDPTPSQPQEPTPVTPTPNQPPVQEHPPAVEPQPSQPTPVQPTPVAPKQKYVVGKIAVASGVAGAAVTGLTFVAITNSLKGPIANLGGYATAQIVAKNVNKLGLALPTGPALTKTVSHMGGPKSTGAVVAIGVGVAVAGAAVGGYLLYKKMNNQ